MASAQLMRFMHIANSANTILVESHCVSCGSLIAAGPNTAYLKIAESAHRCPARKKLGRAVGVKELGRRSVA